MKYMLALLFATHSVLSFGQEPANDSLKTRFSLEVDPGTIAMNGFGIHAGINPAASKNWFVGISAYTVELPKFAVDLSEANANRGWGVRINYGLGVYGEYFFDHINKGWFLATQIGIQKYQLTNTSEQGSTEYTLGLVMPYFGYSWQPFRKSEFYLKPWAGIGYSPFLDGSSTIGAYTYETSDITPLAALHLGFTFRP